MAEMTDVPESPGRNLSGVYDDSLEEARAQDFLIPISKIGRIMRKAAPHNGKISKDAKEFVQECVSEFIIFVTNEANYRCLQEKRKNVNGNDLVKAIATLGFDEYVEPLKLYLQLYRDAEGYREGSRSVEQSGKRYGAINGGPGASHSGM